MSRIFLSNITLDGCSKDVLIADGLICSITPSGSTEVPADSAGVEVIDCTGKTAVPAFINGHTHSAMSLMRGIGEDLLFPDWIDRIWQIESKLDDEFIYWGTKVACLEMISTGTSIFNDMYWFQSTARKAAAEMGIHMICSYILLDHFDPEESARQKDECIKLFQESASWGGSATFAVSIHAVYTVSEELILWGTDFARRNGLKIHMHISETMKEVEDCKAAHGGMTPVEYLDSLGVLGPDVIAAHTLWLSENDVRILGERGVNCVHNINSNLKLASGYRFPFKELTEAGVNICIGTDGCASSNNLDMLEAMKTSAIVQKAWREDPSILTLNQLMDMATVNGARALGIKSGILKEGYRADISIVDTDNTYFLSSAPFAANFIYSANSSCISSLISGGKFVMRDRQIQDSELILSEARKVLKKLY